MFILLKFFQPMGAARGQVVENRSPARLVLFVIESRQQRFRGLMNQLAPEESDPNFVAAYEQIVDLLSIRLLAEKQADVRVCHDEQLEKGFDQLTTMINGTQDLIWFVNREKQLLIANEASSKNFFELVGVEMQPGLSSRELLSPSLAEYFDQVYSRAFEGKTLRFNHNGRDGREYAMIAQPVKVEADSVGVSVFGSDITELDKLQEELRRFEQLVSSTPDLIALVDRHYQHSIVNDSYLGAFNKSRQEMLDTSLRDLIGEKNFRGDIELNLEIAFSGETVHTESWIFLPEFGNRLMSLTYQPLRSQEVTPRYVVINGRDITAVKQAEHERQRIFDVSLDMLCVTGFDGKFKELNPAWTRTLGWSAEELKNRSWSEFVIEEDQVHTVEANARLIRGENLVGFENRYRCKDGTVKWLSWSAYPELGSERIFSVIRDISADKEMQAELRHLATTDPLTGANNRRYFIDHVNLELKRSRRHGLPLAVLLMDIDHFKSVNDSYGHDIGDEVLCRLVDGCLDVLRETDLFGRYGGEEFAAALVKTDQAGALQVCERLCDKLRNISIRTPQGELKITVSIGLTMLSADDLSIDSVLKRADDALYRAKNSGRDQVALY